MGFRIRIGKITWGPSGIRFSFWRRRAGVSVPLAGKSKNAFGVFRFGPFRWFFNKVFK